MAAVKNGREYLTHVTETLRHRITQLNDSIEAGQKEIEGMHEYYWENYTEMDQYGYENFDNQQALLHEINASNEKISVMRATMSLRSFISELQTLRRKTVAFH